MIPFIEEINKVKMDIIVKYNLTKIILFGSYAKGWNKENNIGPKYPVSSSLVGCYLNSY